MVEWWVLHSVEYSVEMMVGMRAVTKVGPMVESSVAPSVVKMVDMLVVHLVEQ